MLSLSRSVYILWYFSESQDVDLDAILGELTALESQYDEAIIQASSAKTGKDCLLSVRLHPLL